MTQLPLVPDVFVSFIAQRCATCRHWVPWPSGTIGTCVGIGNVQSVGAWTVAGPLISEAGFGCVLHEVKEAG